MQYGLQFKGGSTPEIAQQDVDSLVNFLRGKGWVKASAIDEALHFDERKVRAIAEGSDGVVISGPGCPGYKVFNSIEELRDADEAANRLESQANRMLCRADRLRRRAKRFLAT